MTRPEHVPEDVRRFLHDHVEAFEHLEVLVLLRARARAWTAGEVAPELGIEPDVAQEALAHLHRHGLAEPAGTEAFRYASVSADQDALVDGTAQAYERHRVAVVRLLSANAIERLRDSSIRTFSEAFRLRGKKSDD